jgi:predicted amidohydrolase
LQPPRQTLRSAHDAHGSANNGLPDGRASPELNAAARATDIALATENRMWVIRADVAGRNGKLTSLGCSEIVNPEGDVVQVARLEDWDLLVANINVDKRGE